MAMKHPLSESFKWLPPGELKVDEGIGNKVTIKGKALFAGAVSRNLKQYVKEELVKAARTLRGKPLTINHNGDRIAGHVMFAEEEDESIEYVAEINNKTAVGREFLQKMRDRKTLNPESYYKKWHTYPVAGVSVEADYLFSRCTECGEKLYTPDQFNTHMRGHGKIVDVKQEPRGIYFKALSLVEPPEVPGVPGTTVELAETAQGMSRLIEIMVNEEKEKIEYMTKKSATATETPTEIAIGPTTKSIESSSGDVSLTFLESITTSQKDGTRSVTLSIPETKTAKEADYPWDQCVNDRMADGYDEDSAKKICAGIKNRTISHTMEFGLAKTEAEAIKFVAEKLKTDPLFNYEIEKFVPPTVELKQSHPTKPALAEIKLPSKLTAKEGCDWGQAGYTSFEDCVVSNSGKGDPEAYCASIMRQLKGETQQKTKLVEVVNQLIESLGIAEKNQIAIIEAVATIPITQLEPLEESNRQIHKAINETYGKFQGILAETKFKDIPTKLETLIPALTKIAETQQNLLLKLSEIETVRATQTKELETKFTIAHETLSQTVESHTKKLDEQENKHKLLNEVYGKLQKDYGDYVATTEAKLKEKDAKIQEVEAQLKKGEEKKLKETEELTTRVDNLEEKLKPQFAGHTAGAEKESTEPGSSDIQKLQRGR